MANVGRPKSEKVCKLNITITEDDKDFLRERAYSRTSGNDIVTISDIIAEYIEADRSMKVKEKTADIDAKECLAAIASIIQEYLEQGESLRIR